MRTVGVLTLTGVALTALASPLDAIVDGRLRPSVAAAVESPAESPRAVDDLMRHIRDRAPIRRGAKAIRNGLVVKPVRRKWTKPAETIIGKLARLPAPSV